MLAIYAQENDNPWPAGGDEVGRVLACLEDNPFFSLSEMQLDVMFPWQPYDRGRAALYLDHNPKAAIGLRAADSAGSASIARHQMRNLLQLKIEDERLRAPGSSAQVIRFTEELARVLPRFAHGGATADLGVHDFYVARGLDFLPDCFGSYIGWHHLMSPPGYRDDFDAEVLRTLPAHEVRELPGEWFAITSYPDPYRFADDATRRKIVELTEHLNDRLKDWQEPPPE
jgi:hypothetical protein